ncbi:hypothetical protein ANN_11255 [Periplaneta americana]|uniref:BED-type domain-containing protein n=1 Tax=Periplaneta americana TaxID=6978 RepID=A0ABQ8T4H9_PERAM|nr:hypothetical protein ANN_11255 [Periplaneta americana]
MPCPSQTSGFNVPNYVRSICDDCPNLTGGLGDIRESDADRFWPVRECSGYRTLRIPWSYFDDMNNIQKATGVAQSVKALACRSEVALGRGAVVVLGKVNASTHSIPPAFLPPRQTAGHEPCRIGVLPNRTTRLGRNHILIEADLSSACSKVQHRDVNSEQIYKVFEFPSRLTIHDLVNKVRRRGSFLNNKRVQQRSVLTEEKLDEVGARLEHSSRNSLRRLAQNVNISNTSAFVVTRVTWVEPTELFAHAPHHNLLSRNIELFPSLPASSVNMEQQPQGSNYGEITPPRRKSNARAVKCKNQRFLKRVTLPEGGASLPCRYVDEYMPYRPVRKTDLGDVEQGIYGEKRQFEDVELKDDRRVRSDGSCGNKMAPKRISVAWKFFNLVEDNNKIASCKFFGRIYSKGGGTSNLLDHLKRSHNRELEESADNYVGQQLEQSAHPSNSAEKVKLDKLLIHFVSKVMQPLSVVEDAGFIDLVKGSKPRLYSLPCRNTVSHATHDVYLWRVMSCTRMSVCVSVLSVVSYDEDEEGRRGNPVPARSLLLSNSTKGAEDEFQNGRATGFLRPPIHCTGRPLSDMLAVSTSVCSSLGYKDGHPLPA